MTGQRPQVQERLTTQIYIELKSVLDTDSVMVVIEAKHMCVSARGIKDYSSSTVTEMYGGDFNIYNIRFIGQVLPSEVPNYLNSSDILLLPSSAKSKKSREYTSAMKLFEYLASGIPIIASNITSNTESLTGDKNCILFNPDDSDSLVREIKKLWQNYDLREFPISAYNQLTRFPRQLIVISHY